MALCPFFSNNFLISVGCSCDKFSHDVGNWLTKWCDWEIQGEGASCKAESQGKWVSWTQENSYVLELESCHFHSARLWICIEAIWYVRYLRGIWKLFHALPLPSKLCAVAIPTICLLSSTICLPSNFSPYFHIFTLTFVKVPVCTHTFGVLRVVKSAQFFLLFDLDDSGWFEASSSCMKVTPPLAAFEIILFFPVWNNSIPIHMETFTFIPQTYQHILNVYRNKPHYWPDHNVNSKGSSTCAQLIHHYKHVQRKIQISRGYVRNWDKKPTGATMRNTSTRVNIRLWMRINLTLPLTR